ncbi:hypothetical protein KAX02_02870 [candidate division WOR-3 bacterium]|nr:hypothetical protein [candidate division WOR-3 bacterium]
MITDEQTYKLEKAIQLIEDTLRLQNETNSRVMAVWLSVAGDYCSEVAKELRPVEYSGNPDNNPRKDVDIFHAPSI